MDALFSVGEVSVVLPGHVIGASNLVLVDGSHQFLDHAVRHQRHSGYAYER